MPSSKNQQSNIVGTDINAVKSRMLLVLLELEERAADYLGALILSKSHIPTLAICNLR